jgi:ubiquinone/menaquinone biosynthesis C-methylase UbiE
MAEQNAYILGTDPDELFRLGVQHQVWASEAHRGWDLAGFTAGQTILDLGSGPGFCTKELALIVGKSGEVIAIDKSGIYIDFINNLKNLYGLNITAIEAEFDHMDLQDNSLDGVYCRWALAWIPNPEQVIGQIYKALKPGGRFVIHEYFNWMTHQTTPAYTNLSKCINACFKSFDGTGGRINIGRAVSEISTDAGFKIISTRPMNKMARVNELTWQWPITFYKTYFHKLVELGYLSQEDVKHGLDELKDLEKRPDGLICCPSMIELIIEK